MENNSDSNSQIKSGLLSDTDIRRSMENNEILIHPFEEGNLTPVGYNLTPSDFILSINSHLLVEIYFNNDEKYCYIEPNDTVVIMTREALKVGKDLAGTFHSRVSLVSRGLGHISTTLDPLWQGPLLISLNNPTKKRIKLILAKVVKENEHEKLIKWRRRLKGSKIKNISFEYSAFVTLMFTRTITPATKRHNNPSGRFDLLNKIVSSPLKRNFFFSGKRHAHSIKLKEMIESIGSIEFISNKNSEQSDNITIEQFKGYYDKFSETLSFLTNQAQKASRRIIGWQEAWYYTKLVLGILLPIGFLWLVWIFSDGAELDGRVAYVVFTLGVLKFIIDTIKEKRV
ncbi:hypothetical protein FZW96_19735 [Bacillus sp. BGMRC 2118]|nr:hypothetical protein FZW96_19735 [Bacillus sp. BGMRC 2118]